MNVKNYNELCELTVNYALENDINKIVLFSKSISGVMSLIGAREKYGIANNIGIIVVTFPMNQEYLVRDKNNEIVKMEIELHNLENIKVLEKMNIRVVSSMLPFDDIITRSTDSNKNSLIEESLSLVHPALPLAIQASLMATDNGLIIPNERIISLVRGLSIDTTGCNTRYLFHPDKKIKINEIIGIIKED